MMHVINAICSKTVNNSVVHTEMNEKSTIIVMSNIEIITYQLTKKSFVVMWLFYSVFDVECYHLFHSNISVHFDEHKIPTIQYNEQLYPIFLGWFQFL